MKSQQVSAVNFGALHTIEGNPKIVTKVIEAISKELPDVFVGKQAQNSIKIAAGGEGINSPLDTNVIKIVEGVIDDAAAKGIEEPKYMVYGGYSYGVPKNVDGNVELLIPSTTDHLPVGVEIYSPKGDFVNFRYSGI